MDYPFIIQNITRDSFYSDNISATDQFYFIKKMPQLYYSLGQDIVLYDRDTLHTNMQVSSETLVSNFLFSEEEYGSVVLTGGIYGNGKVVSNYQIYDKSFASSLFYYIQGDEVEDATTANNFFGRRGVINNMKLEVSRFDYNNYYKDIAFFATKAYGAWIVDCEVGLSSTSFPNGLEIIPTTSSNILYGGFVAHLYSEVPSDEEFIKYDAYEVKDRKARIIGCVSNVDITIRFNQQEYLQNSNTRMGGIVGSMYGASIINCTNAGKLGGSQVGGIVNSTYDVNVESDISWANVISGCANRANLVSYATKVYGSATGTMCNSGGIISYCGGSNTYVVNCLQTEVLTVLNGNYEANPLNATAVIAAIGGIVGNKGGNIIMVNCLNLNKISYDGEGEIVQRVLASGSVFCGLSAVSLTAVGGSYYLSTAGCNYTNGVAGSQESFDVGETDLKQNANMTFVSLGTINNADSTISNLIVEFSYPGDESKKIKTNLLYEPLISQINLFYFDGTNYPTLRTYTII